jgi:tetratricopeptide (TPR) repeat protein
VDAECPDDPTIAAYARGDLPQRVTRRVSAHVDSCHSCKRAVGSIVEDVTLSTVKSGLRESEKVAPAAMPQQLGNYQILRRLGAGGMGVVYEARHQETGEPAAVKTVRRPYGSVVAGLRCEIHALTQIRHPGIVRIFAEGVHEGLPWYAMELLSGRTLADEIRRLWSTVEIPNPPAAAGHLEHALKIVRRLCAPLAFTHGMGMIHGDLKPGNVFIRETDQPVLMDFGLVSRFAGAIGREVIEVSRALTGTAMYMSPEQAAGRPLDARSDLYALGCILYELLTGHPPFRDASSLAVVTQHLLQTPTPPSSLVEGISPKLELLVMRLLSKEPRRRIGHADDVAATLAEMGAGDESSGPAPRAYLYRPRMAGRVEVLEKMADVLDRAVKGSGSCAVLSGESGLGKTCFAAAVGTRAAEMRMCVVASECVPIEGGLGDARGAPLHPFRPLLVVIADACREQGAAATEQLLGSRGKILAAIEPALLQVPGQASQPDSQDLPAEAARQRLFDALRETLVALASLQPLLLVIDDLQWADELSIAFLASLSEAFFTQNAMVLLGTFRPEEVKGPLVDLLRANWLERLTLRRLDSELVSMVVGDMLALDKPPQSFVDSLSQRSSGNPFFVAEYLRAAVAGGLLRRKAGAWQLSAHSTYDDLGLPDSLKDLVRKRLALLNPMVDRLLAAAAVLGREVDGDLVVAVAGADHAAALEGINELLSRQVIEEVQPGRFRFIHDKLREIAYDKIARSVRCELHQTAALAIEARCSADADLTSRASELAYHFAEAGDARRAVDYLEKAGMQAARSFANLDAVRNFSQALSVSERASLAIAPRRRAAWQRELGSAHLALGQLTESLRHIDVAVELLGYPMPTTRLQLAVGLARQIGTQVRHRLYKLVPARGAEREMILDAARTFNLMLPASYFVSGQLGRIIFAALSDLNLAERAGPSPELAIAYANAHLTTGLIPWPRLADTYRDHAMQVLGLVADPAVRSWVYILAGAQAAGAGRLDEAIDLGRRVVALGKEVSFPRRAEMGYSLVGMASQLRGDFTLAKEASQATYDSSLRGDPQSGIWGLSGVAQALLSLGQAREALTTGQGVEKLPSRNMGRPEKIFGLGVLAMALLRNGDARSARETALRAARSIAEGTPTAFYCINGYSNVAEVFLELWASGDGTCAQAAHDSCREMDRSARVFPVHRPRALLYRALLEYQSNRPNRARKLWNQCIVAARQLRLSYEEALADVACAQFLRPPDRDQRLRRARHVFAEHSAAYDLARVDALLCR